MFINDFENAQTCVTMKNVDLISRGGRGSKSYETLSHKWKL